MGVSQAQVQLARDIRRELSDANDGDFDIVEAQDIFVERVMLDTEQMKLTIAESAFRLLDFSKPKVSKAQIAMPGMPPDPEEYLNIGPNQRKQACKAKLVHLMLANQRDDEGIDQVQERKRVRRERTDPLMPYLAQDMTWEDAAVAYERDHPSMEPDIELNA